MDFQEIMRQRGKIVVSLIVALSFRVAQAGTLLDFPSSLEMPNNVGIQHFLVNHNLKG